MKASDVWPAVIDIEDTLLIEQPLLHSFLHAHAHAHMHSSTQTPRMTYKCAHICTCTGHACAHREMLLPFLVPWLVIQTSADSLNLPPGRFRTENEHNENHNETIVRLG